MPDCPDGFFVKTKDSLSAGPGSKFELQLRSKTLKKAVFTTSKRPKSNQGCEKYTIVLLL